MEMGFPFYYQSYGQKFFFYFFSVYYGKSNFIYVYEGEEIWNGITFKYDWFYGSGHWIKECIKHENYTHTQFSLLESPLIWFYMLKVLMIMIFRKLVFDLVCLEYFQFIFYRSILEGVTFLTIVISKVESLICLW